MKPSLGSDSKSCSSVCLVHAKSPNSKCTVFKAQKCKNLKKKKIRFIASHIVKFDLGMILFSQFLQFQDTFHKKNYFVLLT